MEIGAGDSVNDRIMNNIPQQLGYIFIF